MALDLDDRPRLVFWEMTRACPLACIHCRAVSQRSRDPGELTTEDAFRMIDDLGATPHPRPVLILTGGDCLMRDDLEVIVSHAHGAGVPVAIAPAVSDRLEPARLRGLRARGAVHASLSLDGAVPGTHDGIRGIAGHFDATLDAVAMLQAAGFRVQINTAVMAANVDELADVAALLAGVNVRVWEVFFLIDVGRAQGVADVDARAAEDVCHFLVDAGRRGLIVRTVEAPFYRRVERSRRDIGDDPELLAVRFRLGPLYRRLRQRLDLHLGGAVTTAPATSIATRDGKGVIFVAADGSVYPSGFLPHSLGNVRERGLLDIYRHHPLLIAIRAAHFPGMCGHCTYRDVCGGSRARAFAVFGDPLGDDAACIRVARAS